MAAVEVSAAPGEIATNQEKMVDPAPAETEPQENSVTVEDSAAKETPVVEKLDETSSGEPDQQLEKKPNGVEETSIKETGETAAEQAVPEEIPAKESAEVKEETPEVAAAEVTEEPKEVFFVKESEPEVEAAAILEVSPKEDDPEVEPAAIVEATPAKEDDPEASQEPSVEKLASVPTGKIEKSPGVDGGKAAAAEAAG